MLYLLIYLELYLFIYIELNHLIYLKQLYRIPISQWRKTTSQICSVRPCLEFSHPLQILGCHNVN
jgi:hypothetical protein